MKVSYLITMLKGNIHHIDKVDVTDIAFFENNVPVYPKDVKAMLLKYLPDDITSDELSN